MNEANGQLVESVGFATPVLENFRKKLDKAFSRKFLFIHMKTDLSSMGIRETCHVLWGNNTSQEDWEIVANKLLSTIDRKTMYGFLDDTQKFFAMHEKLKKPMDKEAYGVISRYTGEADESDSTFLPSEREMEKTYGGQWEEYFNALVDMGCLQRICYLLLR